MFVTQQTAPNTGNFILLVLAVYGAIADSRYIAKGGKKAPKWTTLKLAAAFGLLVVVIGLRDPSPESIGSLAGMFFVIGFAGYEAWRWYIRRKNPLINRSKMQKSELLAALQSEIRRHDFSHFVEEPPSVAQGGKGIVVPGCPSARGESTRCRNSWIIWRMMYSRR